jgi:hypothetical protein
MEYGLPPPRRVESRRDREMEFMGTLAYALSSSTSRRSSVVSLGFGVYKVPTNYLMLYLPCLRLYLQGPP